MFAICCRPIGVERRQSDGDSRTGLLRRIGVEAATSACRTPLPRPGGPWTADPHRVGLKHRGGHAWHRVRAPWRLHVCAPQSALVWTLRTRRGWHHAAVLWCACGAVTYPGRDGCWIAKNIRRHLAGLKFPAWHGALIDLDSTYQVHAHP